MGIITKEVKTKWNNMNKSWLMSKGYNYTSYRDEVIVNVNDLQYKCGKPTSLGVGWIAQKIKIMCM